VEGERALRVLLAGIGPTSCGDELGRLIQGDPVVALGKWGGHGREGKEAWATGATAASQQTRSVGKLGRSGDCGKAATGAVTI
jgi:hypothetical protein